MVVVIRDERFCPGTDALINGFGYGLVWEEEGDTMSVEGGDTVAEVSLYLKVILRDVNRNNRVTFVRGDNSLKESPVFLS